MMYQPQGAGRARAKRVVEGAGYNAGGMITEKSDHEADVKMIRSALRQHETQEHGGKHSRIKLKDGGYADGGMAGNRLDQRPRSGGSKKHQGPQINVVVAGHPPPAPGATPPPPMAAPPPRPAPPPMMPPPRPPMAGPPGMPPGGMMGGPGMMPPGAPPPGAMPPRPMGIKTGGNVGRGGEGEPAMTAGAGSGEGRLQKRAREE